jgi:hypothetical protein
MTHVMWLLYEMSCTKSKATLGESYSFLFLAGIPIHVGSHTRRTVRVLLDIGANPSSELVGPSIREIGNAIIMGVPQRVLVEVVGASNSLLPLVHARIESNAAKTQRVRKKQEKCYVSP